MVISKWIIKHVKDAHWSSGKGKSKTRRVIFKMTDNTKFNKDVAQKEFLYTILGSVNWNILKNFLEVFTKAERTHGMIHEPANHLTSIYHMDMFICVPEDRYKNVHSSIILSWPPNRNNLCVNQQ